MNNFITNVSYEDIQQGYHEEAGENSMLIQIVDMDHEFPKPLKDFKVIHQFKFDDETEGPNVITDEQAKKIAEALTEAKEKNMNVVVHCFAGLCRSGAVTDVGIEIGFNPPDRARHPNSLVRMKLRKALNLAITPETSMFA
jgi:predicted protein tyrosine phosphatase